VCSGRVLTVRGGDAQGAHGLHGEKRKGMERHAGLQLALALRELVVTDDTLLREPRARRRLLQAIGRHRCRGVPGQQAQCQVPVDCVLIR
jgi:hypothetical protein